MSQNSIITITEEATARHGVSQRTGKPYTIREQAAMMSFPNGELRRIRLTLGDDQAGYPPGQYRIDFARSVVPGKYGDPELARQLVIERVAAAPAVKAA